ncbi:FHA domain-containing protein [Cereibacter sp. SYSU M97828]|nr:FHA domain-containing protein [Cereibacter flavus]
MTAMTPAPTGLGPAHRGGLMLNVLDGLHRGVVTPISGEICTIGSGPGCDVVLADRQIAPDHLRVRFYGRQVAVDALGGDVMIEGRQPVQRGHGCRTTLPVTLALGGARFEIRRNAVPDGRRMIVGLASALLAVLAVLIATQSSGFGVADAPRNLPPTEPAAAAADSGAEEHLRERIAQAGLDLSVLGDGRHLAVSGSVTEAQAERWTDVQRWFDGTFGGRNVLSSSVTVAAPATPPKFAFQAVWFGANPYVVDARGERRYPGAALQGGWMLKSIDEGAITVSRDGRDFQLTL